MLKKLLLALTLAISCIGCNAPEPFIRSRVVLLRSSVGQCSGEQIHVAAGKDYILTAGHCRTLVEQADSKASFDDGYKFHPRIVAEDPMSDLLLLSGRPHMYGLEIAKASHRGEHIRTFTHGAGHATYKTEGELIEEVEIAAPVFEITDEKTQAACQYPKTKIVDMQTIFGGAKVCVLSVKDIGSTAVIVPGSSGGVAVNDNGDLIGVCDATNGPFGFLVRLKDIQHFLKRF